MTKQEIKDLVQAKLYGQGNQVDLGSALPKILDEVIDLIPTANPVIEVSAPLEVGVEEELTEDEKAKIISAIEKGTIIGTMLKHGSETSEVIAAGGGVTGYYLYFYSIGDETVSFWILRKI